ncbi:MAG TPA: pseudouridine synthase [Phycisphaerae bacterium]|nr:pseudouridine synthase [Phycisphaerae bacterium]HPS52535.1 pseudouridine synthase [Phycisphaerae bacterium]
MPIPHKILKKTKNADPSAPQRQNNRNTTARRMEKSLGSRPNEKAGIPAPTGKVRLHKYLAELGVASRRTIEEMIVEGRIVVNEHVVTELPFFVNPDEDRIKVDGVNVRRKTAPKTYFLLNKPKGVVCTTIDQLGRPCVVDLLPPEFAKQRIYCVGRLDADSTGAILLTNDGELTQHLTHPSHEVPKTYIVTVRGTIDGESFEKIRHGVYLDGRRTQGADVKILQKGQENTIIEMTLREGRNREIRRTLLRLGHKVKKLQRTAIGPLTVKGLGPGHMRMLSKKEVESLWKAGKPD